MRKLRTEEDIIKAWKGSLDKPLCTIICTTFNHGPYIEDALEGFLKQITTFPFQLIIHDDASTDNTTRIIHEYSEAYPNLIQAIIQPKNTYSRGIKHYKFTFPLVKGKYLAKAEGDDYWTDPEKLQKQITFLEENPDYSMCFTNFRTVDAQGNLVEEDSWKKDPSLVFDQWTILTYVKPKLLTLVFRMDAIGVEDILQFKGVNGDNHIMGLLTAFGPGKFLNFSSGAYRVHPGGVWSSKDRKQQLFTQLRSFKMMIKLYKTREAKVALNCRLGRILRNIFKYAKNEKSFTAFVFCFWQMLINPLLIRYFRRMKYVRGIPDKEKFLAANL